MIMNREQTLDFYDGKDSDEWCESFEKFIETALDDFEIGNIVLGVLEKHNIAISYDSGIDPNAIKYVKEEASKLIREKLEKDPNMYPYSIVDDVVNHLLLDRGEFERLLFDCSPRAEQLDDLFIKKEIRKAQQENGDIYVELDDEIYEKLESIASRYYLEELKRLFSLLEANPERYLEEYRETIRKALADKVAYHSAAESCVLPKEKEEPKE